MHSLFDKLRSEQNLFSAWRHVKKSALNSPNNEIKGLASEFEHRHQTHLRRIGRQISQKKFIFGGVTGILKDRKKRIAAGKNPRPIAIAPLENRIVQRALLQVLQPRIPRDERDVDTRFEAVTDPRLGKINDINRSRYGVGGLLAPFGGVRPAIEIIMNAMSGGAAHFFQSDIRAFFTKIPTERVVEAVRSECRDRDFVELFNRALEVHLSNKDELQKYADLFPKNGIGVAQGSSLSAFSGNVLLYDLDHAINSLDVTAVRYIDDILIVSRSEQSLRHAVTFYEKELNNLGMALYEADRSPDKASKGLCVSGIQFLGCALQPNRCVPSARSIKNILADIKLDINRSKLAITKFVKESRSLDPDLSRSAILQKIGRKLYGWQKSFSFCTEIEPFRKIDLELQKAISEYESYTHRITKSLSNELRLKVLGVPSAERLHQLEHNKK